MSPNRRGNGSDRRQMHSSIIRSDMDAIAMVQGDPWRLYPGFPESQSTLVLSCRIKQLDTSPVEQVHIKRNE